MKENNKSPMQIGFWLNRINPKTNKLYSKEEAIYHIKSFRKSNIEYWIERGFSKDDAEKKRYEFQSAAGNLGNKKLAQDLSLTPTHIEYWLKKGYSYKDAQVKLKERQTTFSYNKCIEKYGIKNGNKIFHERQIKWQRTLNTKSKNEILKINKKKNVFAKFIGKNIIRDDNFFIELEKTCKKRKNIFIDNEDDLKKHICNLYCNTSYIQNKGIRYFLDKICPKYLYQVLGITRKTVEKWLSSLRKDIITTAYYVDTGKIHSYHMITDDNSILLSKHEILFYKKLKQKKIKIEEINKPYPNSSMEFDFKINGRYIEIAGLMNDNIYKSKILYKRETYKSFVLITEKEYDDFIQKVLINNDKNAIEYYLTRPL